MGLGLNERFFEGERAGDSYWCMRVIHYPPLAAASASVSAALPVDGEIERSVQLSCGEHTDYGARLLTQLKHHLLKRSLARHALGPAPLRAAAAAEAEPSNMRQLLLQAS